MQSALIPRTECVYMAVRRQFGRRHQNQTHDPSFIQAQRNLGNFNGQIHVRNQRGRAAFRQQHVFNQTNDPSVIPFNLRLKKLAKERDWRGAVRCLREIQSKGLLPDQISYATAIDACSKALKSKPAVMLFEEMKHKGIRPNVPIYNAVMNACARDHQWKQSLGFLDDMAQQGLEPNIVTYNVCLSALEKSKKWNIAVDLMKKIRSQNITLQAITYNTVISACAKSRKMSLCEEILSIMKTDGFKPDAFTYSSLLNGYRKIRDWDSMFRIVNEMKENHTALDKVIYSTVIGACADAGKSEMAFELFSEMKANGIKPNEVVYSCVLRACDSIDQVDNILAEMTRMGVKKNSVVFTSAINVSLKVVGVDNAIRWFEQMLSEGIKPDWVAYMSLFEVLSNDNEVELLDKYYAQGLQSGVLSHYPNENFTDCVTVDLHGWSTALSRAALRNVMNDYKQQFEMNLPLRPLVILTGKGYPKNQPVLRPAVTKMLESDFEPPLNYEVEKNGELHINQNTIINWIRAQKNRDAAARIRHQMASTRNVENLVFPSTHSTTTAPTFPPFFAPQYAMHPPTMPIYRSRGLNNMFPTPRFALRWQGEDNPLNETHTILGRDSSPPVTWHLNDVRVPKKTVVDSIDEDTFHFPGFIGNQFEESAL